MTSPVNRSHPALPVEPAEAVVLGETLVDLIADPPGPLEDAARFTRHLGGACANVAVGLSRQGVTTALITQVGGDAFGRFVRARLLAERVVIDAVGASRAARTGVVFVGGEGFLSYRHSSADLQLTAADFSPAHVTRGRLLHIGSGSLVREGARAATLRAVELARGAGMLVTCDVNFRPHQWAEPREAPPLLRRLLRQCDVVKLTDEELPLLCQTEQAEVATAQLRRQGVGLVVVTQGDRGSYVDSAAGQSYFAAEPGPVVDLTGAGDAYMAGVLAVLLRELGPGGATEGSTGGPTGGPLRLAGLPLDAVKRACSLGASLAARACGRIGAT